MVSPSTTHAHTKIPHSLLSERVTNGYPKLVASKDPGTRAFTAASVFTAMIFIPLCQHFQAWSLAIDGFPYKALFSHLIPHQSWLIISLLSPPVHASGPHCKLHCYTGDVSR
ncbi:hypothetical protein PoB_000446200 [Plakobranchus ocellatus]|uniref:Uncharacterized protein n=1 Tax=Plakobranchus ocellatus TaxID=259542 RepID=A0AAV3Y5D1_9GAST|nr:hypothetical protein PoB_000446200 [Plakobranchus ocellatus]